VVRMMKGGGRRRSKGAWRSENVTNETHFLSVNVSSEPCIKPLDVAAGSAVSHFKMSDLLA